MSIIEVTKIISEIYRNNRDTRINKSRNYDSSAAVDELFKSIKPFDAFMKERKTSSVTSAMTALIADLYFRKRMEFEKNNFETCFNQWRSGSSSAKRLVVSPYRTNHIVDVISALNANFGIFSEPDGDFAKHVGKVSAFLASMSGSKDSISSMVAFYPRSIYDIAFMYCTYICATSQEFREMAKTLEEVLHAAREKNKKKYDGVKESRADRRSRKYASFGITNDIKEHVVVNIINVYKTDSKKVISELSEYIAANPEQFSVKRHYCIISDMLKWFEDNRHHGFDGSGKYIELPDDIVSLYIDDSVDYYTKDQNISRLAHSMLDCFVCEQDHDTAEIVYDLISTDKWGELEKRIESAIVLMRLAIIISIAERHIEDNYCCRPEDVTGADQIIGNINSTLDELGLVHLNLIVSGTEKRQGTGSANNADAFDWCICEYIKRSCNQEKAR